MASPAVVYTTAGLLLHSPSMILTHDVILAEIAKGRLAIEPLAPEQIGPASIDLHLGDEIRVFDDGTDPIEVTEDADYRAVTRVRRLDDAYVLQPGETIHAITRERLHLPPDVGGWLEGRSRYARPALMSPFGAVHGGFIAALLDTGFGIALHRRLDAADRVATHSLNVTYVAFSRERLLFCRTRVVSLRKAVAVVEGEVTTGDGTLVAKALGTFGVRRA